MPISGLTDAPKAFLCLGRIKKGEMQGNRPVDLDYFRVTFLPGKQAAEIEKAFRAAYGDRPTDLNVRFASNNVQDVWDANYECYKKGGLIAKAGSNANGAFWIYYRDPDSSEVLVRNGSAVGAEGREFMSHPIDTEAPIYKNAKGENVYMEPVGRLQVVIPEVAHLAVGYFIFQPGSPRDIRNISAELSAYDATAQMYGKSISGIPFVLRRRQEEITKNIDGKLSKGASWVVHLDAGGEWGTKALAAMEQLALPDSTSIVEGEVTESHLPDDLPDEEPPAAYLPPRAVAPQTPTVEMIDPLGSQAVEWAAAQWNITKAETLKALRKGVENGTYQNPMPKSQFKSTVLGK